MSDIIESCREHCKTAMKWEDALGKTIADAKASNDPAKMRAAVGPNREADRRHEAAHEHVHKHDEHNGEDARRRPIVIYRTSFTVVVVAVALNYPWEMVQAVLYEPMGSIAEASWRCFVASLGDAAMIVMIFVMGWLVYRRHLWFQRRNSGRIAFAAVVGALIGVAVEWWGVSTGRWEYDERMPRVPVLQLGLVPLLQMPLLAPLTFWITAGRMERRPPLKA
jgi:hypothetical protein